MLAIRLAGAKGDITGTDHVAWKLNRMTPYVSSPLLYDDTLYFLRHNQNILSRLEPATGKPRGEPLRLEGIRDFIFASPVGAAGRIYVTGRDGATVVLRHDRENATLARQSSRRLFQRLRRRWRIVNSICAANVSLLHRGMKEALMLKTETFDVNPNWEGRNNRAPPCRTL